jgi:hypothetical protein
VLLQYKTGIKNSLTAGLSRFKFKFLFQFRLERKEERKKTKENFEIARAHSFLYNKTVKIFRSQSITQN